MNGGQRHAVQTGRYGQRLATRAGTMSRTGEVHDRWRGGAIDGWVAGMPRAARVSATIHREARKDNRRRAKRINKRKSGGQKTRNIEMLLLDSDNSRRRKWREANVKERYKFRRRRGAAILIHEQVSDCKDGNERCQSHGRCRSGCWDEISCAL